MSLESPEWQLHQGDFRDVWRDWWGRADRKTELEANKVVYLPSNHYCFLKQSEGWVFIKQEYHDVYSRLGELQSDNRICAGVVLTGQPGTGKTYCLYFLLLKKLVDREPILFSLSYSEAYYFSSDGVQVADGSLRGGCLRGIPESTWALFNTDQVDNQVPPAPATENCCLFIVQATPPHHRYIKWVSRNGGRMWCVKQWTRVELLNVLKLHPKFRTMRIGHAQLSHLLDQAISKWGWAPGDISDAIYWHPGHLQKQQECALHCLTTTTLLRMIYHARSFVGDDMSTHPIVSMYQSAPEESYDSVAVDFKSEYIRSCVQHYLPRLHEEEAENFISYCREHRESPLLASWVFQATAVDILCSADHHTLLPAPVPATWNSAAWVLPSATTVSEPGRLRASTSSISTSYRTTGKSPARHVMNFRNEGLYSGFLQSSHLYIPYQSNFPLFDGFYLRWHRSEVTVVVLQMTISATHKGSSKGYVFLQKLKDQLESLEVPRDHRRSRSKKRRKQKVNVSFEYHLVVPAPLGRDRPECEVVWEVPGDIPDEVDGPHYIQAVPIEIAVYPGEEDESSFDLEEENY